MMSVLILVFSNITFVILTSNLSNFENNPTHLKNVTKSKNSKNLQKNLENLQNP